MATVTIEDIIKEYKPKTQAALEKFLPRSFDEQSIEFFFGKPLYGYDIESATQSLLVPIWDLLDRGLPMVHFFLDSHQTRR